MKIDQRKMKLRKGTFELGEKIFRTFSKRVLKEKDNLLLFVWNVAILKNLFESLNVSNDDYEYTIRVTSILERDKKYS